MKKDKNAGADQTPRIPEWIEFLAAVGQMIALFVTFLVAMVLSLLCIVTLGQGR